MRYYAPIRQLIKQLVAIKFLQRDEDQKNIAYKKAIFNTFRDLGGVYIKFLQILAVNHNFMKGWASPKEFAVFEGAPAEPLDIKKYIDIEKFISCDSQPFATGSFAMVYKGQLKNGQTVVVKVLRPSVISNLDRDLKIIRRFAKVIAAVLPGAAILDYGAAAEEFCRNTKLETDYCREVANTKYFYDFYADSPYVVIPKIYEELSNDKVIVQDYIDGPTFADVLAKRQTGPNLWRQLTIAGGEFLRMAVTAEWVFGDPHPGNIKLLPDGRIGFIDFGLVCMRPTSQRTFYNWLSEFQSVLKGKNDVDKLIETTMACFCPDIKGALEICKVCDNEFESVSILEVITTGINEKLAGMKNNKLVSEMMETGHLFLLFVDVLKLNSTLNVKINTDSFQLLKALQSFLLSLMSLDEREGQKVFAESLRGSLQYALDCADMVGVKNDVVHNTRYSLNESYELIADTLSSLAAEDQFVFNYVFSKV